MAPARSLLALLLVFPLYTSCGDDTAGRDGAAEWTAVVDTLGDTITVRTVAGSVWNGVARLEPEMRIGRVEGADEYLLGDINGFDVDPAGNIYIHDRQVPVLRKYGPDGEYLATFGREGAGPGEYRQSDGGVAVLPDGRVLLRDPGNARINVYSPDGTPLDSWPIRGGRFVSSRLIVDSLGTVYTQVFGDRRGMATVGPDEPGDTLDYPDRGYEGATVTAQRGGARQTWGVPFSPSERWTFSPHGYMVGGVTASYAVDVIRANQPVVRFGRDVPLVPVSSGERAFEEERVTSAMSRLQPGWKWQGPGIPDVKPAFKNVYAGRDGRVWVQLATPGKEVPVESGAADGADGQASEATSTWVEPVVFDVFEPDGRYLGQVRAPDGFATYPVPVFDGDRVWAVTEDDLGVQYLTRFRLDRTSPASAP